MRGTKMMLACAACLAAILSGCARTRDHLTIRPDGSGTVELEMVLLVEKDVLLMRRMWEEEAGAAWDSYPPFTRSELEELFAGADVTIDASEEADKDGHHRLKATIAFDDIGMLTATPYGLVHRLVLEVDKDGGTVTLRATGGMESVGMLMQEEGAGGMPSPEGIPGGKELVEQVENLESSFAVTMPGPVSVDGEGITVDGRTATSEVRRKLLPDTDAFLQALARPMVLSCPAAGVGFGSASIICVPPGTYDSITEGPIGTAGEGIDEEAVRKAVTLVPVSLMVTRTFDFAGVDEARNMALFKAALRIPPAFKPQQTGTLEITEARDDLGTDLRYVPKNEYDQMNMMMPMMQTGEPGEGPDYQVLPARLKVPPRGAKEVARLEGRVALSYPGQAYLVRIDQFLTEENLPKPDAEGDGPGMGMNMEMMNRSISHALLEKLGCTVSIAYVQPDLTINMTVREEGSVFKSMQFYDAEGKPALSFLPPHNMYERPGEERSVSCQLIGRPTPPLRAVVLLVETGAEVRIPLKLEHIPFRNPPETAPAEAEE